MDVAGGRPDVFRDARQKRDDVMLDVGLDRRDPRNVERGLGLYGGEIIRGNEPAQG